MRPAQPGRTIPRDASARKGSKTVLAMACDVNPHHQVRDAKLWYIDPADDDLAFRDTFTGRDLARGRVDLRTAKGSYVNLQFRRRKVGP